LIGYLVECILDTYANAPFERLAGVFGFLLGIDNKLSFSLEILDPDIDLE
jgi:hypothetical protein